MAKQKVLFLCTGNSARSQMGEAFLRAIAGDRFEVYSAGIEPHGVNPYTVRVMDEIGIDISAHTSDPVERYMGQVDFDYVITVCGHADKTCPQALWSKGLKLHWGFDDPASETGDDNQKLTKFREIRDLIGAKVRGWVEELG